MSDPADCDDDDPARGPALDEVPGNDIDEDCSGADKPGEEEGCGCTHTRGLDLFTLLLTIPLLRRRR